MLLQIHTLAVRYRAFTGPISSHPFLGHSEIVRNMFKNRITALMVFYGAFALAGVVVPWYYNILYMRETGQLLTPQMWIAGGFVNSLTASITTDFLIGTLPVLVWMIVEGRRLGMRNLWFFVVTTFLIAFAFSCPFFLLMREVRLRTIRENEGISRQQ